MSFFSQVVLRWREPEAFLLSEDRRSVANKKWWLRPLILLAFVAMMMLGWGINKFNPHKHPPDFIVAFPLMVSVGFFIFYLYPWLLRRHPTVVLYSNGVKKMGMQSMLRFKDMTGFGWSQEPTYYVLKLVNKKGRGILFGVPDPMIRQKINEVLRGQGLQEVPPLN